MKHLLLAVAVFSTATITAREARAVTFVLQEAAVGSTFPQGEPVVAAQPQCLFPSNGNFRAVIQAAANYWSTIYTLPYTITVTFGFSTLPATTAARSSGTHLQASGAGAGIIDRGYLMINPCPSFGFYVDANTNSFSEYSSSATSQQIPYFGKPGKAVEVGRFTGVSSMGNSSNHNDLYTTVLHELGHLLGLALQTYRYNNQVADGDVDVVSPTVCPGLSWMSAGAHLTYSGNPNLLMYPTSPAGVRRWPSQGDISTIAQISGWTTTSWGPGGGGATGVAGMNPLN